MKGSLFEEKKPFRWGCLLLPLLIVMLIAAAAFLNGALNRFPVKRTERLRLTGVDKGVSGFKILHISDLNGRMLGAGQKQIEALIRHENYHAVCLTGDMVGKKGNVRPLLSLMKLLPRDVPVFLVAGDEDPTPVRSAPHEGEEALAPWVQEAVKAGAIYLDSPQKLAFEKHTIWFCPAELLTADMASAAAALEEKAKALEGKPQPLSEEDSALLAAFRYRLDTFARAQAARQEMLPKDTYIALSHVPLGESALASIQGLRDGAVTMANFPGRLGLILAGHLNNGQVHLPFAGPVYVPRSEWTGEGGFFPGAKDMSGLTTVRGVDQYISPGLSVSDTYPWWARLRVLNAPAISVLTLQGDI